jgi:hypothetical protein
VLQDPATERRYHNENVEDHVEPHSAGARTEECAACGAIMWSAERTATHGQVPGTFSMCCRNGIICLPPLQKPPTLLLDLHQHRHALSNHFLQNIRMYNCELAMASHCINIEQMSGVHQFKVSGELFERISSLIPRRTYKPAFLQQYIVDPQVNAAVAAGKKSNSEVNQCLLTQLRTTLTHCNPYAKDCSTQAHRAANAPDAVLVYQRPKASNDWLSNHTYLKPKLATTAQELALLRVGDGCRGALMLNVHAKPEGQWNLQNVSNIHHAADPLLFPLLHPNGDAGFSPDLLPHLLRSEDPHSDPVFEKLSPDQQAWRLQQRIAQLPQPELYKETGVRFVSMREFYVFRIQVRILFCTLAL